MPSAASTRSSSTSWASSRLDLSIEAAELHLARDDDRDGEGAGQQQHVADDDAQADTGDGARRARLTAARTRG